MNHSDPAEEYPKGLRLAIKSIDSELSFDILILLIKNERMDLDELSDNLAYHSHQIKNKLDSLQTGGLVAKKVGNKSDVRFSGKYEITSFGSQVLNCVSIAGNPNVNSEEITDLMQKEN